MYVVLNVSNILDYLHFLFLYAYHTSHDILRKKFKNPLTQYSYHSNFEETNIK